LSIAELNPVKFSTSAVILRRWQGRVYQAISGTSTGVNAPTHEDGDLLSEQDGVIWRFRNFDYGLVRITAVASETAATATVVLALPDSVTQVPTFRWWPPAWSSSAGWPDRVHLHDQRLVMARGRRLWMTKPTDINSVEEVPLNDDSAVSVTLRAEDGSLPDIEWMLSGAVLVLGLRDSEWIARPPLIFDPITTQNLRARPKKNEGSAPHVPAAVDGGALVIGRTRKRMHFIKFDDDTDGLDIKEVSLSARHILKGAAQTVAWQRDPNRIAWTQCANGLLVGLTFNPEEQIIGWHRHPMINGYVEDVCATVSLDETVTELHLIVRRTIDGQLRRYSEILQPFFEPLDDDDPTAEGAWFLDCALQYSGAPITLVQGLEHLEGQEVGVHADGAMRARATVTDGTIRLARAASEIVVGIPIRWKVRSLPFDLNTAKGSTKGDEKRATHVIVDMLHAAGGTVAVNDGEPEPMHQTGGKAMGQPIALRSGSYVIGPVECPAGTHAIVEIGGDDTMPFTLLGMSPNLDVLES
jgi:hypothetical protein